MNDDRRRPAPGKFPDAMTKFVPPLLTVSHDDQERRLAARYVVRHAKGKDDARELLEALGLR